MRLSRGQIELHDDQRDLDLKGAQAHAAAVDGDHEGLALADSPTRRTTAALSLRSSD